MADLKPTIEISFLETFICSAFAACFAELCTVPLDTAKVRLQLQRKIPTGDGESLPKYRGSLGTLSTIAREEGISGLWKGVIAGLHRQCIYGGLRIGLYEPVKTFLVGSDFIGDIPLYQKILAALLTGAIAIIVANPTDLVKVRLQSEGKLPAGVPRRYAGAVDAYFTIVKLEGVSALGPNIARNAIVNAAELASYDQIKEVKSRMMGDSTYRNTIDCFIKTMKTEGIMAFYKGFLPNFTRLGTWNVVMFLTLEQVKKVFLREVLLLRTRTHILRSSITTSARQKANSTRPWRRIRARGPFHMRLQQSQRGMVTFLLQNKGKG